MKDALRPLPKRFYTDVATIPRSEGYVLVLDGKSANTPGKAPLMVPTLALAERLVAEWAAQDKVIDPATMPLTRIINSAIDGVTPRMPEVRDEIVRYAGSDLICYRAAEPDGLVALQQRHWDPILAWAETLFAGRFARATGLMPVVQPAALLERISEHLVPLSPFVLAGLHVMTTLTGSSLLALAHYHGRLSAEEAWRAAHIDEDWQETLWGVDAEAAARRALRWREMQAASALCADGPPSGSVRPQSGRDE